MGNQSKFKRQLDDNNKKKRNDTNEKKKKEIVRQGFNAAGIERPINRNNKR